MSERAQVGVVADIPVGGRVRLEVDGIDVVVVRCGQDELLAIEDVCSHDGAPLDDGPVDCAAGTIECPRHGSLFDLRTGKPKTLPAYRPVETFPVEVENGVAYVVVEDD